MSVNSQRCRPRACSLSLGLAAILLGMAPRVFAQGANAPPPAPATPVTPPSEPPPPSQAPSTGLGFSAASGHLIVSADRLFGVWAWSDSSSTDIDRSHTDDASSGTAVSVLWANGGAAYEIPRLALDGLIGPVTFGGSFGYLSSSGSGKSTTSTAGSMGMAREISRDLPKYSAFALAPRVGAVVAFGERLALWVRGGVTYFHSQTVFTIQDTSTPTTTSFTRTNTANFTALTLDPELVILAAPHFGFMVGAVADIGLGGSSSSEESSSPSGTPPVLTWNEKLSSFGMSVGILGFF